MFYATFILSLLDITDNMDVKVNVLAVYATPLFIRTGVDKADVHEHVNPRSHRHLIDDAPVKMHEYDTSLIRNRIPPSLSGSTSMPRVDKQLLDRLPLQSRRGFE